MAKEVIDAEAILNRAKPLAHQQAPEIQPFGHLVKLPIALAESACRESVDNLNQLLADTITLRDLYKKHHWQVAGPTFYQLHLLFDKHYEQQNELVDKVAERIQLLGGVSIAIAHDVADELCELVGPVGCRQVGRYRVGAAAGFAYLRDDAVGFFGATAIMHENLRTGCGKRKCTGAAHAAGSAGNESGFAGQSRHGHPPCCCCG